MVIDVPFDYTCLLALKVFLQFENKRIVPINSVLKFRETLLSITIEDYKEGSDFVSNENWKGDISFREINYQKELDLFISQYMDIIDVDSENFFINQQLTLNDLNELLIKFDISDRFSGLSTDLRCLDALGVSKIREILLEYIKYEDVMENEYSKLSTFSVDRDSVIKNINIGLSGRAFFISKIFSFDENLVRAFYFESINFLHDDISVGYKRYPIDIKAYENSEFYQEWNNLNICLYDAQQYAIFGEGKLGKSNIRSIIEKIDDEKSCYKEVDAFGYEDDEEDSIETDDINFINEFWMEEEFTFYLKYIDNINRILNDFGMNESLIRAKYRLLYVLDNNSLCLYDDKNFELALKKASEYQFNDLAFDLYVNEAKYFISEIFDNDLDDDLTLKKALFIKTYYDLTGDNEIVRIFEGYKGYINYNKFYNIIFDGRGFKRKKRAT